MSNQVKISQGPLSAFKSPSATQRNVIANSSSAQKFGFIENNQLAVAASPMLTNLHKRAADYVQRSGSRVVAISNLAQDEKPQGSD